MDIQMAIENLRFMASENRLDTAIGETKQIRRGKIESINMAIAALEKRTPKKPIFQHN